MLIEKKNVAELLPADYNPRKDLKPGDKEYEKLKRSIEQFGYVEPVIWNATTSRVVGGHQRLKVLIDMGITEVECVIVEMDEDKEKALNVALTKSVVNGITTSWPFLSLICKALTLMSPSPDLIQKNLKICFVKIRKKVYRMTISMWMLSL